MRSLDLFAGAGGGLLAGKLLGWTSIGYVEWEPYCQRVLQARIADGYLDAAPIFGDIRKFISEGYAASYTGMVDVLTAGFPCQPFSTAGFQLAENDPKNQWPATKDAIRIIRPKKVLLENVPGLLTTGYAAIVTADLASLGYVGRNIVLSAAAEGANHLRERVWFYGDSNSHGEPISAKHDEASWLQELAAHANSAQLERICLSNGIHQKHPNIGRSTWWQAEPGILRVDDGLADWVDERLQATGNGQVPIVAARAWQELSK
jgi:DNA (cytosine-5)-methyltransferase 1